MTMRAAANKGFSGSYKNTLVNSTSSQTLPVAASGIGYHNTGAVALTTHTLPAAVVGLTYTWFVTDADGYRIQAPAGVTIYIGATASTVAGNIQSVIVGSVVRLVCVTSTLWLAAELTGTWTAA